MKSIEAGYRSGALTAIAPLKGGKYWLCSCDCGMETKASKWHLLKNKRTSCGCRQKPKPERITCRICEKKKDRSEFYIRRNGALHKRTCKICERKAATKKSLAYQKRIRLEVLSYYGGTPPKCACCGEKQQEFLSIDHIEGGGNKHRREENIKNIYKWLRKNKYPIGFQVLCRNCNFSLGAYGYCPHSSSEPL